MKRHDIFKRISIGVRNNPFQFIRSVFVVYSILWTILEPSITFLKPSLETYLTGWNRFLMFITASFLIGLYQTARPKRIILKQSNATIIVMYGDLFTQDGIKAIPVSRFMYETDVVSTSLQHTVIRKYIESEEGIQGLDKYRKQLKLALKGHISDNIYRSATQQSEHYFPLGTTALIELNDKNKYLFCAITKTELKGNIPPDNSSVTKMWAALEVLWQAARENSRGSAVNIPLIGSGVTGINLPPIHILELNILGILNALAEGGKITTGEIRIVLHEKYLEEIDLASLERHWDEK